MTRSVLIDCDPGHDDAIALLLAVASPELRVLGVTTVGGNTTLEKTTRNALTVLELANRTDISVAAGAPRPLCRPLSVAEYVHGESGLDGPRLEPPTTQVVDTHAVPFLREAILSSPEPVTLIPMGPLTNVALLLATYPEVTENLEAIVFMGGAALLGNRTPGAEFNVWADPEAAARVLMTPVPITMAGLDVTHQALVGETEAERLRGRNRSSTFVAELLDFFRTNYPRRFIGNGVPIHDVVAVAQVVDPTLMESEHCGVRVDTAQDLGRGRTVVDRHGVTDWPKNVHVGFGLDRDRFVNLLLDRLDRLP